MKSFSEIVSVYEQPLVDYRNSAAVSLGFDQENAVILANNDMIYVAVGRRDVMDNQIVFTEIVKI